VVLWCVRRCNSARYVVRAVRAGGVVLNLLPRPAMVRWPAPLVVVVAAAATAAAVRSTVTCNTVPPQRMSAPRHVARR
jgi:hypothetical protein